MQKLTVHLIAAARPNFMKVAPLYHALRETDWANPLIVHTGQHYDKNMSEDILTDLRIPAPEYQLGVGSGSHAEQVGQVMMRYEKLCSEARPDCVVVVGDVNSTAACAQVGAKMWIPVIHLEAGLRSGDRRMPEEINRLITDSISDILWTPSADATENLLNEGVAEERIDLIGNIMIDSFEMLRTQISKASIIDQLTLADKSFALVTLHRPSNVDDAATLGKIIDAISEVAKSLPVIFVSHPRTIKNIDKFALRDKLMQSSHVTLLGPTPYIDFMRLVTGSSIVITDSGGIQEETTYLRIPCLTLRENTERPITMLQGTNRLVRADDLRQSAQDALEGNWPQGNQIPFLGWHDRTARSPVNWSPSFVT